MFDFTREIQLPPQWQKRYRIAQFSLYGLFVFMAIFVAYKILFPTFVYNFTFGTVSLKNTIIAPRNSLQAPYTTGALEKNATLIFNTNPQGSFTQATITLTANKNKPSLAGNTLSVKKSYQAFLYPTGEPIGFKNGSLLKSQGIYYLVSSAALRAFADASVWQKFGLSESAFSQISSSDLAYNSTGDIINDQDYPDGLLFRISNTYYQLKNKTLLPFISDGAYLSQYSDNQAIRKDDSFFATFPQSDTYLGYASGTLATSGQSVYILSNGKAYPIDAPTTFESLGYSWNDVISITSEELGIYAKQKQFTIAFPHPDGTIFKDQDSQKYYMVTGTQKRPLPSLAIVNSYLRISPVLVNEKSETIQQTCTLKKNFLPRNSYSCTVPVDKISALLGNSYQFSTSFPEATNLYSISTSLSTPPSLQNAKNTLSNMKRFVKNSYTSN